MDVEERDGSRSSKAQNIRRRTMTKTLMEDSRPDDEGEEGDEFRSSTVPNTRRSIVAKRSPEEERGDERTAAVTTQESLDGIHGKAMRIASVVELEVNSGAGRWSSSKLRKDLSLKRAIQNWNMKYVDIARSRGPALREFTSSEQLANHLKINEIGEVGKLV